MEWIIPLMTLILLEVVLGLDNVIFISIVTAKLPKGRQKMARNTGLLLAMVMRLALLGVISLILKLQGNLFTVFSIDFSGKDLILIAGGLFLIYKGTTEIYHKTEATGNNGSKNAKAISFRNVIAQIILLDLVFSVDSIITAIGMVEKLWVMYAAVIISVGIMLFAAGPISKFIHDHPSFKMLALSFLLLIGVSLIGEGLDFHIPKGYIYFSMGFALFVDLIQMRTNKTSKTLIENKETRLLKAEEPMP
jgi:predicted tellurium resistance membrane protein TerC